MKNVPQEQTHVVILGGGYAGVMAARRLAGKVKRGVTITLISGADTFVERIRLHQAAAGTGRTKIAYRKLLRGTNVRFVQGWVTHLDPARRQISLQTVDGRQQIFYDRLVYALGSVPATAGVDGVKEYAFTLSSPDASAQLNDAVRLAARRKGRLLVVGGGLTGIEAATELAEAYPALQVTLATSGQLGPGLSPRANRYLRKVFRALDIELLEQTRVTSLSANAAHMQHGEPLPFDVCLWAGSFRAPALAAEAGLPVDPLGRVRVGPTLQVEGQPDIYVAGDAAASPLRMACATALPMGAYVADHLAAELNGDPSPGPFRFAYTIQCISLGRRRGLVQFVDAHDAPAGAVITGMAGAFVKELVCRYTIWSLRMSNRYRWPAGGEPLLAPASQHDQEYERQLVRV
ncbi:MAG: FAD-dependent oxidoreductase [Caldilineaceae bacterium]|nr:FAD-dependent oxidoreductase [Caldilineaceae bacterium]